MRPTKIHFYQLLALLGISLLFVFIEYLINSNSIWVMLAFFILSYLAGSIVESIFKKKLFKTAIEMFISSLKDIRRHHKLPPKVIQSIMTQVTDNLVEVTGVNVKTTSQEIAAAGKYYCKTCEDPDPHLTDADGQCNHCRIGLSFWKKMEKV